MLKKQMEQYIVGKKDVELFDVEKEYANKQGLLQNMNVSERKLRFQIIERCHKETEELIQTETTSFLQQPISYLSQTENEFIYIEAEAFEIIGVDAIVLEQDDVFKTITALFGLKLQKKYGSAIQSYLNEHLQNDLGKYSIMFSDKDGLWDMNIAVNHIDRFSPSLTIEEVVELVYRFVFQLLETIEEQKDGN